MDVKELSYTCGRLVWSYAKGSFVLEWRGHGMERWKARDEDMQLVDEKIPKNIRNTKEL